MTGTMSGVTATVAAKCARQRASSTYKVKVMAGSPAPGQVQLESLEQHLVQRQVPLTQVLGRPPAGAELELDQPEVRVVLGQRVGDATQVVHGRSRGGGVAHHRPLDRVRATHLALLGRRGAV